MIIIDLEIDIEIMWHLKITSNASDNGRLDTIEKGTDKHINEISSSPNLYKIQNVHFTEIGYGQEA